MINKMLFFLMLMPALASAQSSGVLERYVEEGLKNNLALKQEALELKKSLEVIRQAKALFYPHLTFNPTYSYAAGGRRLSFPVGDLLNPAYRTLNELTGTTQFPTNIENVNELLAPTNFHDTKISVKYSIYNPEVKYNYLIQKSMMSAQEAKRAVVENELRYGIETSYYQYLQTLEVVKILDNSNSILNELVKLNKKLVSNNTATKDVVFSAEYEVSKLQQQKIEAVNNTKVAAAYFNFLINRNLDAGIDVDSLLLGSEKGIDEGSGLLMNLKQTALTNRSELKQLDQSLSAARYAVTMQQKAAAIPSFYFGGNAGFQGFGYTFQNQAYMVGQVGLQWDIFKGYERKSKIQQAKIQTELLQTKKSEVEKQIELQTTQAYYDYATAGEAQRVSSDALTNASQYFKVIDSRYKNGNVLMIEYLKAQNDVQTARLQQVIAKYDVLIKKSVLDKTIAE
jgi:outer membrane protein